jgi:DNA-directed RNA polymerase specialized sigma24 family protein
MDLDETIRELAPQLLRFSPGQTGDAALAEEAAQEALTALVPNLRSARPPPWTSRSTSKSPAPTCGRSFRPSARS